ncbi:hypothetical protein AURDEDRAFT_21114, partial [Auricularia subglabra TFB-10046 SS5]
LSQRTAHKAIKLAKKSTASTRRATATNIARIQEAIRDLSGVAPMEKSIWEDLGREGLSRNTRNFLWKGIHGAHKVGEYFEKMPEPWKSYGRCKSCEVPESLEHILTQCPDSGQEVIWSLVAKLLEKKNISFSPEFGLILGCCSVHPSGIASSDRLFKIAVSESAFLAWKIRCTFRIEHDSDPARRMTAKEVASRWEKVLQTRMEQDLATERYKSLRGRRPQKGLARGTWRDVT